MKCLCFSVRFVFQRDMFVFQCEIYAEIGEVINGTKQARYQDTTVFKSVGECTE